MATVAKGTRETIITLASPGAGPFSLSFRLFDDDALDVFVNGVRSADWTLSSSYADGYDDGATITFGTALEADDQIVIQANLKAGRAADYTSGDPQLAAKVNVELARLWSSVADVQRNVARTLRGFAALDPVAGIDLETIAQAETFADRAEQAATEAETAADLATAAQENLFDAWQGAWVTATVYAQGDLVRQSGSTYICLEDHTSGTFSTDLSAGKWEVFAQQGSAGAGTGDMLAANNLNDVASKATARANLELPYAQTAGLTSVSLDTVSATGFYKIGSGNSNGWPDMVAGDLLVHHRYDGDRAVQIGFRRGTGETLVYMRSMAAGSWDAWQSPLASRSYVDTAAAGIAAGWEPYNGTDGLIYDNAGAVANVVSPDFEDGYEYMFVMENLRPANTGGLIFPTISLYKETSAVYGPALSMASVGAANSRWYSDAVVNRPRMAAQAHAVDYHSYSQSAAITDGGSGAVSRQFAATTHTTAQKILRARLAFTAGNISSGTIKMLRRKTGAL